MVHLWFNYVFVGKTMVNFQLMLCRFYCSEVEVRCFFVDKLNRPGSFNKLTNTKSVAAEK